MDPRSLVKLTAAVLALLAAGLLVMGIMITVHGATVCGSVSDPCDGSDQALDAAQATYYAIKTLTFGTGIALGVASLVLLGYLKQTGPNPPR